MDGDCSEEVAAGLTGRRVGFGVCEVVGRGTLGGLCCAGLGSGRRVDVWQVLGF